MEKDQPPTTSQQQPTTSTSLSEATYTPDWVRKAPKTLTDLLLLSTSRSGGLSQKEALDLFNKVNDEDAKKILKDALDECFSENTNSLQHDIDTIKNVNNKEYSEVSSALSGILCSIGPIDLAVDFYKMGGLEALKPLLQHPEPYFRHTSIQIIKDCCSNNPICKEHSTGDDVLGQLITIALDDTNNVDAKTKAVTAVAAIVRDNPKATSTFHRHNGFTLLRKGLEAKDSTLLERTTNLITAIAHNDQTCGDLIIDQGIVQKLIALLRGYQTWEAEYFILALTALFTTYGGARDICLNDSHLRSYLEDVMDSREGLPEFEELVVYAKELSELMNTYGQEKKKPCSN